MRIPQVVSSCWLLFASVQLVIGADVIDESLLMRFNFDAAPTNNIIADTSPAGMHPGTNNGSMWAESDAGRTGVMHFTPPVSDRIIVPAIPALNSSTGTISFWIKTPGNTVGGDFAAMLMDRRASVGDVITLADDGTTFVQARGAEGAANSFPGTTPINDNNWHHVAYVYDQSATGFISIYIDGVLNATQVNTVAWSWDPNQPLEFGSSHDSYWRVFVGLMDDVQIHNRILSDAEIAATFAGNPVLDNSLVERLEFTAAPTNNIVVDTSTSSNSATNQGSVWVAADSGRNGLMQFDLPVLTQITVPPASDLDSPVGTIAFWMKSSGNTGPGAEASIIFDRRAISGGDGDVITMTSAGTIFVQAQGGGQGANSFSTQATVDDGQWHHVAYVYDQSETGGIQVYIDGALSGSQSNSVAWAWPTDQQLELGQSHDGYWFRFDGALDEFRFYNRQLSAQEVIDIGVAPTLKFDIQPTDQAAFVGEDVFLVSAANIQSTYQWRFNGTDLPSVTNATLVLTNAQAASAGTYTVVASAPGFGSITSAPVTLSFPSLAASLVARYNFSAAPVNDVIVDSAGQHNGTNLLATWTASVDTRSGVMQFIPDPGSQIVIPPDPDFDSSKGAITFWMKSPGSFDSPGDFAAMIFDRRTDVGDVITLVDEDVGFSVNPGNIFVQAWENFVRVNVLATTNNSVNDDTWHHVAYVYNQSPNGSTRIYIDGQLAASQQNNGTWSWDPDQPIELGKSHDSYWNRYNGYLDDLQIYNRSLSAEEVQQTMTLPDVPVGPSLAISRQGDQLTISWSQPGFVLQENPDLSTAAGWTDVPNGTNSPVSVTIGAEAGRFYRLRN